MLCVCFMGFTFWKSGNWAKARCVFIILFPGLKARSIQENFALDRYVCVIHLFCYWPAFINCTCLFKIIPAFMNRPGLQAGG